MADRVELDAREQIAKRRDLLGAGRLQLDHLGMLTVQHGGSDRGKATTGGRAGDLFVALAAVGGRDDPLRTTGSPFPQRIQGHALGQERFEIIEPTALPDPSSPPSAPVRESTAARRHPSGRRAAVAPLGAVDAAPRTTSGAATTAPATANHLTPKGVDNAAKAAAAARHAASTACQRPHPADVAALRTNRPYKRHDQAHPSNAQTS